MNNPFNKSRKQICMLLLALFVFSQLLTPVSALAGATVSKQVNGPWIKSDVPFDGDVGAFNEDIAEGTDFSCNLSSAQVGTLSQVYDIAFSQEKSDDVRKSLQKSHDNPTINKGIKDYIFIPPKVSGDDDKAIAKMSDWVQGKFEASGASGCISEKINASTKVSLSDITDPVGFFVKLIGGFITNVFTMPLNLMQPMVMRYAFTTPHTERGDTIFNQYSNDGGSNKIERCGQKPCGFSTQNLDPDNQNSNTWIKFTIGLRGLLSMTYGIIIVAVSIIYMYRQNVTSAYNIKKVLPRVFASVILMMMFPFIIGTIITYSNFIVQAILGNSVPLGGLNEVINNVISFKAGSAFSASAVGNVGATMNIGQTIMNVILLASLTCFIAILFIMTIIKQAALIFAIIMAPIACLAFVMEKWASVTSWWIKSIIGIALIPIIQVMILKIGYGVVVAINGAGDYETLTNKLFAAIVLLLIFYLMIKVGGKVFKWVGKSPVPGIPGGADLHAAGAKGMSGTLGAAGVAAGMATGGTAGLVIGGAMRGASSSIGGPGSNLKGAIGGAKNAYSGPAGPGTGGGIGGFVGGKLADRKISKMPEEQQAAAKDAQRKKNRAFGVGDTRTQEEIMEDFVAGQQSSGAARNATNPINESPLGVDRVYETPEGEANVKMPAQAANPNSQFNAPQKAANPVFNQETESPYSKTEDDVSARAQAPARAQAAPSSEAVNDSPIDDFSGMGAGVVTGAAASEVAHSHSERSEPEYRDTPEPVERVVKETVEREENVTRNTKDNFVTEETHVLNNVENNVVNNTEHNAVHHTESKSTIENNVTNDIHNEGTSAQVGEALANEITRNQEVSNPLQQLHQTNSSAAQQLRGIAQQQGLSDEDLATALGGLSGSEISGVVSNLPGSSSVIWNEKANAQGSDVQRMAADAQNELGSLLSEALKRRENN